MFILINFLAAVAATTSPLDPPTYSCGRTATAIKVDGKLDDAGWEKAAWTDDFVNIEGRDHAKPAQRTRAKLLWDDQNLYLAAELFETDVRAEMLNRDDFIYRENAFEVFFDPDNDGQQYAELEFNAANTIFDLIMTRPYRERGKANADWTLDGLVSAVHVDGTLNDASDVDRGWTIEMAIPWASLTQIGIKAAPEPGSRWRMNFARMSYLRGSKAPSCSAWSPHGEVNMHLPKKWGWLAFAR